MLSVAGPHLHGPSFPCLRVLLMVSHTPLTPPACVYLVQVWIQKYDEDMGVKELEHQEERTALNEVGGAPPAPGLLHMLVGPGSKLPPHLLLANPAHMLSPVLAEN